MLIQLLFAHTGHFAITVFSAFTFFAAGLLYFDSWHVDRHKKTPLIRSIGFFLLAIITAIHATLLEIPHVELLSQIAKIIGLVLILVSLIYEPILHAPSHKKLLVMLPLALPLLTTSLIPLSAILMLLISATYFRKATEGLDRQLKPAYLAFFFLGLAELLQISFYFSKTPVIFWSKILSDYGALWNIQHIFECIGILILAIWVWGYIRFRLEIQLFVSTVALSLILFLTTTVFYTFLLLRNLENETLAHLKTDINVLQYALESVKERTLSYAQVVAQDSKIQQALINNDKTGLYHLTSDFMLTQKSNTLLITSPTGEVMMRTEDADRTNDNVSSDPLVKSALNGSEMATVAYDTGITVPVVSVQAAVPIRTGGSQEEIIGTVVTGVTLDSTFVDGVKTVTGLDIAVFGGDKRAATTFISPDGKNRFVGTLETNKKVLNTVLTRGEVYVGQAVVLNLAYYTAYAPLKTPENEVVGMLFVGILQNTLFDTAKKSINLTFLGSMILIILTLIPAYLFSRFLKEHAEA